MLWLLLMDAPFYQNVKVSNWDISTDKDQTEVTMAISSRWVVASWINMDNPSYYTVNQLAVSSNYGYDWTQVGYFAYDNSSCWVGDPSLASDPNDPDKFYWAGMIWCQQGSRVKGEVYFCTNTGTPDDVSNWSCTILPPNDNWNYFKDKPWLLTRDNNGTTEILVVFTADGYGSTSLNTYEMISVRSTDGGNTWESPVRVDPGYASTVAYVFYDPSTGRVHMSKNCIYCYSGYDIAIEYHTSDDFGATWTYRGGLIMAVPSGQTTQCPNFSRPVKIGSSVAASGQNIVVAGIVDSDTSGRCDFQAVYSSDGGNSWSSITIGSYEYIHPFVTTDGADSFYIMLQARNKTTGIWQTQMYTYTSPGTWTGIYRVSDHDYDMNENPAGHDYNTFLHFDENLFAIWGDDYYNEDAGAIYFANTIDPTPVQARERITPAWVKATAGGIRLTREADIFDPSGRKIHGDIKGQVPLRPGVYILRSRGEISKVVVR